MNPRASFLAVAAAALAVTLACSGGHDVKPPDGHAGMVAGSGTAGHGGVAAGAGNASGTAGQASIGGASGTAGMGAGGSGNAGAPATGGGGATGGTGGAPSSGAPASAGAGGRGEAGSPAEAGAAGAPDRELRVFVFTKTAAFHHDSIADGTAALMAMGLDAGWTIAASEDATQFNDDFLGDVDVVVFLSTTGDVLEPAQEAAFERFITSGKGWVGVHSASDTEYDWEFYGGLVGAYFKEHPAIQRATLHVEDASHPATAELPATWTRTDEWYGFQTNPRPDVHVLLTLDETSYDPGTSAMGGDHPVAWWHEYQGGRAFYTALGHTSESYGDPLFLGHLRHAIEWAGGR